MAKVKKSEITKSIPDPIRIAMLKTAIQLTGADRQAVYGDSKTNMDHFAGLINAQFKNKLNSGSAFEFSPEDAAIIMVLAKVSRISVGIYHPDNFIDAAAYVAIAGECGA